MDFEKVGDRTVVRTTFANCPLRLLTPQNRGRAAWVYTSSLGGGLVGGDAINLRILLQIVLRATALFFLTALAEIVDCHLPYLCLR